MPARKQCALTGSRSSSPEANTASSWPSCYLYQEALTQYQILLREQHAARGPDHPDTLVTRANLAHCRGEAGDPAGAAAAYEELLADQLRVLGPDHPSTLATLAWRRGKGEGPGGRQ